MTLPCCGVTLPCRAASGHVQRHEVARGASLLELRALVLQQEQQWLVGGPLGCTAG